MKSQTIVEYGLPLTLSEAKLVMRAAEQKAREHNLAVIIAVVDSAAQLVMLQRMDHAQFGSIQVAVAKAENAVRFKRPTRAFDDALSQGGPGLRLLTIPGISAVEGGVPLLKDGKIVGAIGAAGMLPHQDAEVAGAGAEAFHKALEG